ncbi:uncharacterized protein LOC123699278 [Colias croceus]|uniref:uncharacterized protein LOC123699278 n=1 Tax=Colias crocea TaxID=72248 RepID=UPI001E27C43B|nr:uncharacterized protein LOC123699278 [Colias croceus]
MDTLVKNQKIIDIAIEISNSNFNFRIETVVVSKDVDEAIINKFLQSYKGTVVVEMKRDGPPPKQVVIFVESYFSFKKILGILKPDLKGKSLMHSGAKLVIILLSHPHNLRQINSLLWDYYAIDVVIIVERKVGNIALYTYFPYKSETDCDNVEPTLIGLWSEDINHKSKLFPDKTSNMNHCPLFISTNKVYHPATEHKIPLQIIKKTLHNMLRDIVNSTLVVINRKYTSIDSDSTMSWSESLNDVSRGVVNISTCTVSLGFDKGGLFDYSVPYFRIRLAWIGPPTTFGSTLWKLLVPLNGYLWLVLLIVSFIVITIPYISKIQCVKPFCSRYFKNLNKMRRITFRTWGVMVGQPIRVKPRRFRDFYLISLWIWFTFIVRSAYQSVLIGALKTDTIIGNFLNLQEAVDDGYHFGGRSGILAYFEHDPIIEDRFQVVLESKYDQTFRDVLENKKRFIIASSLEYAWTLCLAEAISEKDCGYLLPDSILMVPLVVWMKKHSPFVRPLSVWLPRLIESGLLIKDAEQKPLQNIITSDPTPLTIKQAVSCFLLLILGYGISITVFVLELLLKKQSCYGCYLKKNNFNTRC